MAREALFWRHLNLAQRCDREEHLLSRGGYPHVFSRLLVEVIRNLFVGAILGEQVKNTPTTAVVLIRGLGNALNPDRVPDVSSERSGYPR